MIAYGTKDLTVQAFSALVPGKNTINLLVSGQVKNYPEEDPTYEDLESVEGETGLTIVGVTIGNDYQGLNTVTTFRQCTHLLLRLKDGSIKLTIVDRRVLPSYTYFKVVGPELKERPKISFSTGSIGGKTIMYTYESTASMVDVDYIPYCGVEYTSEDYNPVLNNAVASVKNTSVRIVDFLRGDQVPTNLKALSNGSADFAEVPDSYYSSVGNMTGRFLGTKNAVGESKEYIFTKDWRVRDLLSKQHQTGPYRGEDQPFQNLQGFTGSLYPSSSTEETIFSIDVTSMGLKELLYSAHAYTTESVDRTGRRRSVVFQPETLSSPRVGDIVYVEDEKNLSRVPEMKIFVPDVETLHYTDEYGIIIKSVKKPQGNASSYYLRTLYTDYSNSEPYYGRYNKVIRVLSDQVIPQIFFIKFRIDLSGNGIIEIPGEENDSEVNGYYCGPSRLMMVGGDTVKEVWTGFTSDMCNDDQCCWDGVPVRWGIISVTVEGQEYTGPFKVDGHVWNADWYHTFDSWYNKDTRVGWYPQL